MQVTFFSNFLNHHQTPFCDEIYKQLNKSFTFVATEIVPEEFVRHGFQDCTDYPYNFNSYKDDYHFNKALQLGIDSDIVIIGSAPEIFIQRRLRENKLTFRYNERLLKKGEWRLLDPRLLFSLIRDHVIYRKRKLYMLCASAYAANDLNLIFAYPKKKYKWGYFTEVKELNINQIISQKPTKRIEINWTASFIKLKHPDLAVKLAYELKKKGYNFHINMIGAGELVESIRKLIKNLNVQDCVSILGNMPNSEVRDFMQRSNIFIFTSDRNEGWGAVLNEAMSCGCAVIGSHLIGSVPFLIEHNKNGLVFKSGSLLSLVKQTERLFKDRAFRDQLSKNAYYTLKNEWNPKTAANNFLILCKSILNGQEISFETGPCSKANRTKKKFWK